MLKLIMFTVGRLTLEAKIMKYKFIINNDLTVGNFEFEF